ncbi:hypothetical protein G6F43_008500 [Rhizopus delemar]|nr:hypothetical protein G6F43_008500 [Rhizopus delemar]
MLPSYTNHQNGHGVRQQKYQNLFKRGSESDILKFGNPGPVVDMLDHIEYTVSYDRRNRLPHWAGEHLTFDSLKKGSGVNRDNSDFREDTSLPDLFRAHLSDYKYSGYDRGHQAPAGDAVSTQEAMDETFLLSNMAPQVGVGFNREYWAYFEAFVRDLTQSFADVYVFTGPLFLPQSTEGTSVLGNTNIKLSGTNVTKAVAKASQASYTVTYKVIGGNGPNIPVPTHFFKVLLAVDNGKYTAGAFVLPNQAIDSSTLLSEFQVDISAVEKAAGLQFFTKLDRSAFADLCKAVKCVVN